MTGEAMKLALCVLLLSARATSSVFPWPFGDSQPSNTTEKVYNYERKNLTEIPDLPADAVNVKLDYNLIKRVVLSLKLVKLQNLSLTNNLIDRLDSQPFVTAGHKLLRLDLSFNQISAISPLYFTNLNKLNTLFLGSNRLTKLEDNTFSSVVLPVLKQLDLGSNMLSTFEPTVFDSASQLVRLRLRNNSLTRFQGFERIQSLSHLDLAYNKIAELSNDTFAGLVNLMFLDLSGNGLTDLGICLQQLSHLTTLYLNENRISRVKANWFAGTAIHTLTLNGNPLTVIDKPLVPRQLGHSVISVTICNSPTLTRIRSRAFSYMVNLQMLKVCNNERLQRVDSGLLDSVTMPSILTLILHNNSLTTLTTEGFDVAQYKEVDLAENPWFCDCRSQWLADQCKLRSDNCNANNHSLACTNINADLLSLDGTICDDDPAGTKNGRGLRRSRTLSIVGLVIFTVCLLLLLVLFVWWLCFKRKGRKCTCVYTSSWGTKGTASGYRYSEVQKATNASNENEQASETITPRPVDI